MPSPGIRTFGVSVSAMLLLSTLTACVSPQVASTSEFTRPEPASATKNFLPPPPTWKPAMAKQRYRSKQLAQIVDRRAPEISGIAASKRRDGILWAINDSGNKSDLLAFSDSGELRARWSTSVKNRDWEDLASFTHAGKPYLLVAETGDNRKAYPDYALHIFSEPSIEADKVDGTETLEPIATLRFIYPDGPQNSEAVAVSQTDGNIIIVTKDVDAAGIYAVPLSLEPIPGIITANKIGEFSGLPQAPGDGLIAKLTGIDFAVATALDINPQGNTAVLLSYREVYRWTRTSAEQSWGEVLAQAPEKLIRHALQQAEALSFDSEGENIYVISERLPTPVLLLEPAISDSSAIN